MRKRTASALIAALITGCTTTTGTLPPLPETPTTTTTTIEAVTTTTVDYNHSDNWEPNVVQFLVATQNLDREYETEHLVMLGYEMCRWLDHPELVIDTYGEHDGALLLKTAKEWLC